MMGLKTPHCQEKWDPLWVLLFLFFYFNKKGPIVFKGADKKSLIAAICWIPLGEKFPFDLL